MQKIKSFVEHIAFSILLIIIALITSSIYVDAYPEIENYNYLTGDTNYDIQSLNYQNHIIYSKVSEKWYVFFNPSSGGALWYSILNYDGSTYLENIRIGADTIVTSEVCDFDVKINANGNSGYIFFLYELGKTTLDVSKSGAYAIYFTVNPSTSYLEMTQIDVIENTTTYRKLHIVGAITIDGYPVIEWTQHAPGSNYQNVVVYSDNTTSFDEISRAKIRTLMAEKGYNTYGEVDPYPLGILIPWRNTIQIVEAEYSVVNQYWHCAFVFQLTSMANAFDGYIVDDYNTKVLYTNNPYDYVSPLNWGYGYNFKNEAILACAEYGGGHRKLRTWEYDNVADTWTHRLVYSIGEIVTNEYPIFGVMDDLNNWALVEGYLDDNVFRKWIYDGSWSNIEIWNYGYFDDSAITYQKIDVSPHSYNFTTNINNIEKCSSIIVDGIGVPTDDIHFAMFGLDADVFPPLPMNYIKLDGIENNIIEEYGVIIFPNEAHNIEMNFYENTTYIFVDLEDAENYIRFIYNVTENKAYTQITNKKGNTVKNIAYVDDYSIIDNGNNLTLSLDFIFNKDMVDYYSQVLDYGIIYNSTWYNFTSSIKYSLFNLGGIPSYSGSGTYNIYDDNDIFSIGATGDGSYVRFDVLYNKLQHMHFNVELDIDGDWDSTNGIWENCTGGLFEYGWDYFINDELLEGWKVNIYPTSVVVGHQNLGVDYDYVEWTIEHYFYNRTLSDYQLVKTEILYSNFNGYDNENSAPDYHNRTSATFWFDMWFSNDNSSKKVATRVNTEWFGMYEQGSSWWFGYGGFRPVIGELTNSIYYDNVYDENMLITTIRGNVDIVRFWGRVEKVTGGLHEYKMYNYLMKNKVIAQDEMIGVDTPALIETKVMDMPQTGFLSPLIKVLSDIQRMIIMGILGVLSYLSVAIDNMLVNMGLPPLLSVFYNMLVSLYQIFALLYVSFVDIIDWTIEALGGVIDSLFLAIPRYLVFIGLIVNSFILWYNTIVSLFTGGIGGMSDFWTQYNLFEWIEMYLILYLPIMEASKILGSDDPANTFIEESKKFIGLIMGLFEFLYSMLRTLFELLERLLGILPF